MAAYNRITQRFVDGKNLAASDFNAALDDVGTKIARRSTDASAGSGTPAGGAPSGPVTFDSSGPSTTGRSSFTFDQG